MAKSYEAPGFNTETGAPFIEPIEPGTYPVVRFKLCPKQAFTPVFDGDAMGYTSPTKDGLYTHMEVS